MRGGRRALRLGAGPGRGKRLGVRLAAPPFVRAASRLVRPARIYDLRATFASNALAAGVTVFELARVMGRSVRMGSSATTGR
jgi:hypothetical protein